MNNETIVSVFNSLDVLETNGGEDAYIIVSNTDKNRKKLNDVGVSNAVIDKYADDDTFCILSLALSEGYADLFDGKNFIAFEKSFEIELGNNNILTIFKSDGEYYLCYTENGGIINIQNLSIEQIKKLERLLH